MEGVVITELRVPGGESRPVGEGVILEICASAEKTERWQKRMGLRAPKAAQLKFSKPYLSKTPKGGSQVAKGARRGAPVKFTAKRLGEMAEAAFVAKVAEMGFSVAKPWGDSDPYDFITQSGGRLCRVQVKSAHRAGKDGSYYFHAHGHAHEAYGQDQIDVLVAYAAPEDVWYVFPVEVLQGIRSLKLFPGSRRKKSKYEKYREAWGRMAGR